MAAAVAATWSSWASGVAAAQACCASAGLIAPTRLRSYGDFALGMEARGRSVFAAFDAGGEYGGAGAGNAQWNLEQNLFGAARVLDRGQVALVIPFIETRRTLAGVAASGGRVGDVSVSGGDVLNCSMPPADAAGAMMSNEERVAILTWVLCGYPA